MIDRFIWWFTISSFGSGMVLPLTALFLVSRTSFGAGGTAAFFAVAAATELLTSVLLTATRTRLSPGLLSGSGYALLAAGYIALGGVRGIGPVLVLAVVVGFGRGGTVGGVSAYLRQMTNGGELRDLFARRYRAMNVGLGGGLLAATLALSLTPSSMLWVLFVANGLTYIPLAVFLIRHRGVAARPSGATPSEQSAGESSEESKARQPSAATLALKQLGRIAGPICLVNLCVTIGAYSQLDSSMPVIANRLSGASFSFVSAMVGVNTVAVVVLQRPITRFLSRWSPGNGMRVAIALWLIGYLVAGAASAAPGPVAWAGLILLAVLFAGGEAAYASSFQPWLFNAVPEAETTRASSMSNVCGSVGRSVGPSFGILLVGTGQAPIVWAGLAAFCVLTLLYVTRLVAVEQRMDKKPLRSERVVEPAS